MLILTMLACGASSVDTQPPLPGPITRPAYVPAEAVHISLAGGKVTVNGAAISGFQEEDLTNGLHEPLIDKLPASGSAWITAPADIEWLYVRKLFLSAREAGLTEIWMGLDTPGDAFAQPGPMTASYNNSCKDGPLNVTGVDTALSLSIQTGSDGTWATGTARFRPIAQRGDRERAIVDLPFSCWAPVSCGLFDDRTAAACEGAIVLDPLDPKVPIASQVGCLLPIIKGPGDAAAWRSELASVLETLEIAANTETLLMVEAKAPWESVTSVLGAFSDRKIRIPALGTPLLEGHEGPPFCDAPIRDADGLREARGIWLGSQL